MSASREKKKRQEFLANGGVDAKAAKAAQQKAAERRSNILYTTVAVVVLAVAAFLLVYNSGILQRGKTALTIDGEKYTVADVSFHYQDAYQKFMSQFGQMAAMLGLDPQKSLKSQAAWGSGEQTWDEYFKDQAVSSMKFYHAVLAKAKAENVTLDDEDLKNFDATLASLKAQAAASGYTYKSYLNAVYGSAMTAKVYEENLKDSFLVSKYDADHREALTFSDEEIQAYYDENKNSFDLVDGAYVSISGTPEAKTDAEGNAVEATDEEKTAAMDAAKVKAEELLAAYKEGGNLEVAAKKADLTATVNDSMTYSAGTTGDWLFDEARQAGDAEVLVDEAGSRCYVAVFNGRRQDTTPEYNVRHILVTKDNVQVAEGETATDEQVLAKAEEILASWDGTEDGFAKLAGEFSQDGGSKDNGGLYENVQKGQMVAGFNDWCYEEGRKAGDTGIVKSEFGQHIMYFVGYGQGQYWHFAANSKLVENAYNEWHAEMTDSVTAEVQPGMNAVG